jgi:RNA polymerase sigma factor (sigma-70 family)
MARFRLDTLASLARQMGFAPRARRLEQVSAAEDLLLGVEPGRAYPLSYVVFTVTGYRPRDRDVETAELLAGEALQHDLGLLVEIVSDAMDLPAGEVGEPVLRIEDVCDRFGVTSKTIQRWRRRGLPARRFVFEDGKKRVGFRLACVERYIANQEGSAQRPAGIEPLGEAQQAECVRRARRLAGAGHSRREVIRRVARRMGRSPLAILHTLEHHDRRHPDLPALAQAPEPMTAAESERALELHELRHGLQSIAALLGRPRSAVYRAIMDARAEKLAAAPVKFHDDPLYHDEDPGIAEQAVRELVRHAEQSLPEQPSEPEQRRVPRGLPAYLAELYRTPLLSPGLERALFLQFNFHKFRFAALRGRLDPHLCRRRDLDLLEHHLRQARRVKNRIVTANLRLVVSVARKHLRSELDLMELVSDGNIVLMRAVEGFDVHRGFRFSTYATLALMKGFARSVPELRPRGPVAGTLVKEIGRRDAALQAVGERDQLRSLLNRLSDDERRVVSAHYGVGPGHGEGATLEALSQVLGVTRHRVRQIEQEALLKLRRMAADPR